MPEAGFKPLSQDGASKIYQRAVPSSQEGSIIVPFEGACFNPFYVGQFKAEYNSYLEGFVTEEEHKTIVDSANQIFYKMVDRPLRLAYGVSFILLGLAIFGGLTTAGFTPLSEGLTATTALYFWICTAFVLVIVIGVIVFGEAYLMGQVPPTLDEMMEFVNRKVFAEKRVRLRYHVPEQGDFGNGHQLSGSNIYLEYETYPEGVVVPPPDAPARIEPLYAEKDSEGRRKRRCWSCGERLPNPVPKKCPECASKVEKEFDFLY